MSTPAAATIMNDEKSSLRIFSPEPIGDSDVVIHSSDGGVLNLHSVLLKMHSKVFAAALEYEDTADSKAIKPITLNYDFATLKIFFSGLGYELDYAQKVETAQAIKLIPLAHKYDVGSIVQTYMKHLLPLVPEMRLRPCSADGNTELSLLETLALAAKYGGEEVYRLSIKTLAEKHRAAADDKERRKRDDTAYFCATYPSLNQDDMKDLDAQSMEDLFVAFAELPRHDRCVDKLFDARVDLLRQVCM